MKIKRPPVYQVVWGSLLMLATLALIAWQVTSGEAATLYGWITAGVLGSLAAVLLFPGDSWQLIHEIRDAVPFLEDPGEDHTHDSQEDG